MHQNRAEYMAFIARLKGKAKDHDNDDVIRIYKFAIDGVAHGLSAGKLTDANEDFYDLIIANTANDQVVRTLSSQHKNQGTSAIEYLRDCFAIGGNAGKEGEEAHAYNAELNDLTAGVTFFELQGKFANLSDMRTNLIGGPREISDERFCADISDMVKRLSHEHKLEVNSELKSMPRAARNSPSAVQAMLEGVVSSINGDRERERKEASRRALAAQPAQPVQPAQPANNQLAQALAALLAGDGGAYNYNGGRGNNNDGGDALPPCDMCGVRHFIEPGGECHAKLLAEGKDVPGWDSKPDAMQRRLQQRADEYNAKGPFKDRSPADKALVTGGGKGGKGGGKGGRCNGGGRYGGGRGGRANAAALGLLLTALQTGNSLVLPPASLVRASAVSTKYGAGASCRLIVDTGNLTGKHLISNKDLFSSIDTRSPSAPVISASDDVSMTAGEGTCSFIALGANDAPLTTSRVDLDCCAYVPKFGVNLLSVQLLRSQGAHVDLDNSRVTFANGATLPFDNDFTLRVVPTPNGAYPAIISRGKRGPTRIERAPLSAMQQEQMNLWSARLNGATADTLRELHKVTDDAPSILRLANDHNAMSVPRLLATGKRMNAPERTDGPIAQAPGQITAMDWWDAPCTGILGSTGLFAPYDNHSGHFRVYPAVSKSEAASVIDLYHRDAAHDGVTIAPGSVVFTDNEKIFTSRKFDSKLSELGAVHEYAAEYEPWGNGGAESVNRYLPAMMRAAHIKGGAPDVCWEFSAVDSAALLCTIMSRDGKSLSERWSGRRKSIAGRKTLFCRALARKPVPWRANKIDAQQVEGVYFGKARRKQGWYVWTPEYGIVASTNVTFFEHSFPFKEGLQYVPHPSPSHHDSGLRILTGLPHTMPPMPTTPAVDAPLPGDYVPPPPRANDDPPPTDPPSRRTRSAHDLTGADIGDLAASAEPDTCAKPGISHVDVDSLVTSARRVAYVERALRAAHVAVQNAVLLSPADSISGADAALLDSIAAAASTAPGGAALRAALAADEVADIDRLAAELAASAAPGGDYIPQSKEKLSELDEAIRAIWEPPDKKEIDGILEWATVCKVKDLPAGTKVVGCSVQRKFKRDGTPKTRVCAQGFSQVYGIHYDRSHSPTILHSSLRSICAVAASLGAQVDFCDFTSAYTQSELLPSEYIHMRPPPGYEYDADGDEVVWHLTRSLYGMVQSGRNWYMRLREWLAQYGFVASDADPCVYTKQTAKGWIILGVYVDDIVVAHTDKAARDAFITALAKDFQFTDQGPLTEMLGIQFDQGESHISLSLGNYIDRLVDRYLGKALKNRKEHKTPACHELPDMVRAATESTDALDPAIVAEYRSLVGALLFASLTVRPDISYAVGMLSRALNTPNATLLEEARRVLYYLALTKDLGPRYTRNASATLVGMADSDWAVRRSTSGFAFFLAGAVIAYTSKKQPTIAMSSTEAEIMAASQACLEAIYLRALLSDLGCAPTKPTDLFVDNKGVIDMSRDYISNERTKHIERRHLKVRELVKEAVINVKYVASRFNVADIFTKPLDRKQFQDLRNKLFGI